MLIPMALVSNYWEPRRITFLLGAVNAAMLPAVQTLILYNITPAIAGQFSAIIKPYEM